MSIRKICFHWIQETVIKTAEGLGHSTYVSENGKMTLQGEASTLIDPPHVKKAYLGR